MNPRNVPRHPRAEKFMLTDDFKEVGPRANHKFEMNGFAFAQILRHFYNIGWMRGTGGACAIITGDIGQYLFMSPSSLQKDEASKEDVFVFDIFKKTLQAAPVRFDLTSCCLLFTHIILKTGAAAIIHSHSKAANLATVIFRGSECRIKHQEYMKGIVNMQGKRLTNEDILVIPIIENKPTEEELLPQLKHVLEHYPNTIAVLVRHHGIFVWGRSWDETKISTECIDYMLEIEFETAKLR